MKKNITLFLLLKGFYTHAFAFVLFFLFLMQPAFSQSDPDEPDFAKLKMSKEEFMIRRAEAIGFRRGVEKDKPFDPTKRIVAIRQMESQKLALASRPNAMYPNAALSAWTELGPNPIPNGQVQSGSQMAVSGRTISIAVHPTDPNIVYVGTAQGGLYRSVNGGTTWVPLLDNALSLAINTVTIAPSQPNTIFVGTGEAGFSADSYFGVGIYRIDNANSVSPTITGPIGGTNFTGRSVSKIVVHPTDPNIIFVSSASGLGGIGATSNTILASKGVFKSTDALSASPTFTKLTLTGPAAQDRSIVDMVMDPGNPDLLLCTLADQLSLGEGGIYRSIDALSASPTFVRTFAAGTGSSASRTELALNRSGAGVVTVYAASGFNGGTVQRSIDGGATFTQRIDNNFCGGQCFYDIAVAVDPINANLVYLGGTGTTTTFTISTDGGATFTSSASGLHTDSHVITVAPSLPSTIYFGSDGGIYKSTNSGTSWVSLNNNTFRATQFMSVAVHPIDPNFSIGGTQDNGTNFYKPDGTWTRADFGDGGYSLIDQNATNTVNVDMYHTYFNSSTLQGYGTVSTTATATEGNWVFRGCNGSAGNGIPCGGAVLFYAPIEQGPGNPNTVYYGANILYRSADKGLTHTAASQNLTNPISAIGISSQNDNVRIVGQNNGGIFGTSTGSTTLTNLDPGNTVPNNFIARAVIDPNNSTTAYVTLSAFGVTNIWKTTNLNSAAPTWTSANSGIPAIPVNAFVVNPANSNNLFAGTDIGVYVSEDGGTSWIPLGTGLPVVAVFDMAIQAPSNVLRIATHGRGLWQIAIGDPVPFIIASEKTLIAEDCAPSNGVIDPGETVIVSLCLKNTGGLTTINLVGTLLATGGVSAPGSPQNYGVVTAGGADVCKNFTFTANNLCGGNITVSLQLQDGATDLGIITYSFSTGTPGAVVTTSYTGPAVPIPDNTPAGVNIILPVSGFVGLLNDIDFRLDALAGCDATTGNTNASVTHTYNGDLVFKLTSPAGTTVALISSRGDAGMNFCTVVLDDDGGFPAASSIPTSGGVAGNFKPESPLSAFDGENPNGNWTLNVSDIGAIDVGTLNRFSLLMTGTVCCQAASCNVSGTGTTTPVSCLGSANGTATITLSGAGAGAPGTYTLDSGTLQPYSGNPFTITGLSGGNHTIVATVTAGGCVSNAILVNVGEPAVFAATYTKTNLSACNNTQDGSITVTATGGSGTYNYVWTGSTGSNNTPYPNPGNVSSISGLNYGYYNVTITDAAGCGTVTYSN
ncbi:MAG: proprotein convertase P-domain-containing protein, partial [Ferruginibacter sp.]